MATQRYVSTSFWDDAWIQTLDPSEKLLYLYLMTNPLTNIAGVYKITKRRICFDTGFNDDTVGHILTKFEKAEKAYIYDEYMVLPSWPEHQKAGQRSKIKDGIDAILKTLPTKVLDFLVSVQYRYTIEGYVYTSNYSDSDSNIDIDYDLDSDSDADDSDESSAPSDAGKPSANNNALLPPKDSDKKETSEDSIRLANLLYSLHKLIDNKYYVSEQRIKAWARDFDKLNRLDKRDWKDIELVLTWAKKNDFWTPNIMSGKKFREKYPTLLAQMQRNGKVGSSPQSARRTEMCEIPEV